MKSTNAAVRAVVERRRNLVGARYEYMRARDRADAALALRETCEEPFVLRDARGRPAFATPRALRLLGQHGLELAAVPDVAPLTVRVVRPGVLLLAERQPGGPTNRERQILAPVAEGRSNAGLPGAAARRRLTRFRRAGSRRRRSPTPSRRRRRS